MATELRLTSGWLLLAAGLWTAAAFVGTAGAYLSRQAFLVTADGQALDSCSQILPEAVADERASPSDWCTTDAVFGSQLPPGWQSIQGELLVDAASLGSAAAEALIRPDFWLTVGLGGSALVFLFAFARATGTIRAGLAVAISVVFLGLLLFPSSFTFALAGDLRAEIVSAWQLIILFYFGSEAAIQGLKVFRPSPVAGDLDTTTIQASSPGASAGVPELSPGSSLAERPLEPTEGDRERG